MTDQLRQAAQQALEALEGWEHCDEWVWPVSALEQSKRNTTESLAALRAALEQQAEPVAWDKPSASFDDWWDSNYEDPANPFEKDSAAYWAWAGWKAAQRPWQGLTDKDWEKIENRKNTVLDTFEQGATWAAYKLERRNT